MRGIGRALPGPPARGPRSQHPERTSPWSSWPSACRTGGTTER